MKPLESIRNSIPLLRKQPDISRSDALAVLPMRNSAVKWSKSEGEITLFVPMRKDKLARMVERVFKLPDTKQVELDEVGSTVWEMSDGEHDVAAIVREVRSRYKLSRREAEASIGAFFKQLVDRKLIALARGGKRDK
jgi:hypothetical protein